mgnify:CR=1 FL=1
MTTLSCICLHFKLKTAVSRECWSCILLKTIVYLLHCNRRYRAVSCLKCRQALKCSSWLTLVFTLSTVCLLYHIPSYWITKIYTVRLQHDALHYIKVQLFSIFTVPFVFKHGHTHTCCKVLGVYNEQDISFSVIIDHISYTR